MNILQKLKNDLKEFHEFFDNQPSEIKLEGLIGMQSNKYVFKTRIPLEKRRFFFEKSKRNRRYFKRDCYVCGAICQHRHHIISLKQGGTNAKRNIVALCKLCHMKIHPWMTI